jgi:tetratricopeptide (TPR) repeat protein
MKSASACCLVFALTLTANSHATTWGEPQPVPDPVRQGAKCYVSEPASYGSYIYQWPSKYDQVFWPLIDEHGLWFCRDSGFTAFIGDFKVTADERAALTNALASYEPIKEPSLNDKLQLLQKSYDARSVDARMKIRLLRVLAYYYEADLKDFDGARSFRREALEMIEAALQTVLPEGERLEYLFVSAIYYRELGDKQRSQTALQSLDEALQQSTDEKLAGYVGYLTELKKDLDKIVPGGPLIPLDPEQP